MYAHTATLKVKIEYREVFLRAMAINAKGSINESNCLRFDVYQDYLDPQCFHLHEVYVDEASLAFHHTQEHCEQCVGHFNEWLVEPPVIQKTLPLFPTSAIAWEKAKLAIIEYS